MVSITICADNLEEIKNPDTDIFYSNKQTAQKIINLAKDEKIKIENEIKIDSKNARFKAEELKHIEESLYNIPLKKYEKDVENVKLFLANNPYSEIEHLAIQIVKLVRNEKYRYKDISIITKI